LPDFIQNNPAIYTLIKDEHHSFDYTDNLCFFRCLALHRGAQLHSLHTQTSQLWKQWFGKQDNLSHPFSGLTYSDLERAEDEFEVNVDVFEFDETQSPPCLVPSRRSARKHPQIMRVLSYEHHFCYITDINKAAQAFGCRRCGKLWKKEWLLNRHEETCTGDKIKHVYPGGVYTPPPTALEMLHNNGLLVDTSFVFPYRATYDFEVFFDSRDLPQPKKQDAKTHYTCKHVPLSVSVCSNVPSFEEPVCFISTGDAQELVNKMVDHLERISDYSFGLLKERFADIYEQLDEKQAEEGEEGESSKTGLTSKQLREKLDAYLHELPVVGFNSSNYDLNVIKPYFFHRLIRQSAEKENKMDRPSPKEEEEEEEQEEEKETEMEGDKEDKNKLKFVVKNNNQFKCVSTEKLKFLDITSFLAPGFSYAKYLAAFDVEEQKGFFPYEFVTDLDKLDLPHLPSREAFFSTLKNKPISEEDYHYCQDMWETSDMKTLRDFLIWYNNKDVVPFLEALEKQSHFYQTLGLDMLKDGIGVPGLTLRYLFKTLPDNVYFSLLHENHKDLHQLLRSEMVGGPSIIFHRYHEAGKTRIRDPDGGKPVTCLEGYDANALYLWALMQDMPTEDPVRRKKENHFKAEKIGRYGHMAREWLKWTMHENNIHLQHKFNDREQVLGQHHICVDGWDAQTKTVYQFHGCLFHALTELRQNTRDITNYLRNTVQVKVIEKWECEWEEEKQQNASVREFLQAHIPRHIDPFRGLAKITCTDIVQAVKQGSLFGLVQCDVEVPERLRDYFSEMPPIFKNTVVGREVIGEFMKTYAERHRLLTQPRKTLIGSFTGKHILLITPLLQWYLHHGLKVLDVQQVVEYRPQRCFKAFGETVSHARRQGDQDPSKAILADTFKLLGNSAYGKTITNIAKHTDVSFTDKKRAQKLINDSLFRKLTPLTEKVFEVEMTKSTLNWNLPLQIGFFVYQYAKLRMLQFHFDLVDKFLSRDDYQLCEMDTDSLYMVLSTPSFEDAVKLSLRAQSTDKFVSRTDYQLLEMDTDSLYMALSASTLEEVVHPELREQFYQVYNQWFPAQACDQHETAFQNTRLANAPWDSTLCQACTARVQYDKRTPGLFKTEYQGNAFIGLCSKTYFCEGDSGSKFSSKGLNKNKNKLTKESYQQVLLTQESGGGTNTGFKTDGKSMFTYSQTRKSLSFFYIKRVIASDGISTLPTPV
ncbi:uncharacterized protein, partial [Littorina saxatilis]|uniref:uncharacterized protein n=1 Tax=Littorina saxatilis TaxID=31220 RepID=UPI0038B53A17